MLRLSIVLVVLLAGCVTTQERDAPPEVTYVPGSGKVFSGPGGVEVAMVKPRLDRPRQALVRVTGTNAEIDGLVLQYEIGLASDGTHSYRTRLHGRERRLIKFRYRGEQTTTELRLPKHGMVPLTYDKERSRGFRPEELIRLHAQQHKAGLLGRVQDFDRKRDVAINQGHLARLMSDLNRECETSIQSRIEWTNITDAQILEHEIWLGCNRVIQVMKSLCSKQAVQKAFQDKVNGLVCKLGEKSEVRLEGGVVDFTAEFPRRLDVPKMVRSYFLHTDIFGPGGPLEKRIRLEETFLCTDGKSHYVGAGPYPQAPKRVFYGDGRTFTRVDQQDMNMKTRFVDPREVSAGEEGRPWERYISSVYLNRTTQACRLLCGTRSVDLQVLSPGDKREMLTAATWKPPPARREPFALARDRRGVYYFIDTDMKEGSKDYRLYRGPKGNMKLLSMTNIVEDSQGAIFSTPTGKLRLIVERENSFWISGKVSQTLLNLPLIDNLAMVYNELGVYIGQPYGTPCDIL